MTGAARATTVALVHGAFEDPSYWWLVVRSLKARGVAARVRGLPRRGLAADAQYLAAALSEFDGPLLLVGHSYGGAVISVAADELDGALGLVYVAGLIPDVGESIGEVLAVRQTATSDSASRCARRPRLQVAAVNGALTGANPTTDGRAVTQPVAASIFAEPAAAAAWRRLPSWAIVASADPAVSAHAQRVMAARAGARTTEIWATHSIAVSHPDAVVAVILTALRATSGRLTPPGTPAAAAG